MIPTFINKDTSPQAATEIVARDRLLSALESTDETKYQSSMLYRTAIDTLVLALHKQSGDLLLIKRARLKEAFGDGYTELIWKAE